MSNIGINELDLGIWTDPNTGLIWARISIGQEWINGQCIGDAQEFNWDDANHACQSFRLAGFSDWRLPTREELETIKDGCYPEKVLFQPQGDSRVYWSSSVNDCNVDTAWYVHFGNDYSHPYYKYNDTFYVRAVR